MNAARTKLPQGTDIPTALLRGHPDCRFVTGPKISDDVNDTPYQKFAPNEAGYVSGLLRPKSISDAEWAEIQAERTARESGKSAANAIKARNKLLAKASIPRDLKGRPLFETSVAQPKPGEVVVTSGRKAKPTSRTGGKLASDDLGEQVSARVGADPKALLRFAKANGVYKPGDENAKNPGLLRMTVVNRLRGRLRRSEDNGKGVVWP